MADILVVVLDNTGLTGIKDIQGIPYGATVPDVGAIVTVDDNTPDVGGKLWVPINGVINIEELEQAMEDYVPAMTTKKEPKKSSKKKTYKTKDTAAEE